MTKILKFIANLLLIAVIVALSAYFLLRVTNKVEIYNVKTGSMEAKIHVGDYILIYKKSDYYVGDVVTYTSNNGFITHRIIKKDGDKVVTKGDANNTEDETISAKIIVGKVIMSGGILNIVIKYKYVLSGIVLSLYLFSCYFESGRKEDKENNNDEINDDIGDESLLIKINNDDETEVENEKNDSEKNSEKAIEESKEENNITNDSNELKNEVEKDDDVALEKNDKVKKAKAKKKIEK